MNPTAGRMAGVASSSRPIIARASTATGGRNSRSPGASPTTSGPITGPRGSPCRGGASWPDPLDRRPRPGRPAGSAGRTPVICAGPRRWPSPSSPRRAGPTARGWTEVSDTYQAPSRASRAIVELHLRWSPDSTVRWSGVSMTETSPPTPRTVRLATVHFKPSGGKTPADNCRMYEPLIAEAARRKADLVVLGETLTFVGLGKIVPRSGRADPGPVHRVFRAAGAAAQPVHRARACSSATATWSTTSRC